MIEAILGIVVGLITILPLILKAIEKNNLEGKEVRETLAKRDLAQLTRDLERVRARKAGPVVSQR